MSVTNTCGSSCLSPGGDNRWPLASCWNQIPRNSWDLQVGQLLAKRVDSSVAEFVCPLGCPPGRLVPPMGRWPAGS